MRIRRPAEALDRFQGSLGIPCASVLLISNSAPRLIFRCRREDYQGDR
jgi:hypothetical protein